MMARYARELEQREEERQQLLEDMKERMTKIAGTVGKMVGDSAADRERADEQRMMDTLAAAEAKSKEAKSKEARVVQCSSWISPRPMDVCSPFSASRRAGSVVAWSAVASRKRGGSNEMHLQWPQVGFSVQRIVRIPYETDSSRLE